METVDLGNASRFRFLGAPVDPCMFKRCPRRLAEREQQVCGQSEIERAALGRADLENREAAIIGRKPEVVGKFDAHRSGAGELDGGVGDSVRESERLDATASNGSGAAIDRDPYGDALSVDNGFDWLGWVDGHWIAAPLCSGCATMPEPERLSSGDAQP